MSRPHALRENGCVRRDPGGKVGIDVVHGYSTEYKSHCIKSAILRLCALHDEKMHFTLGREFDGNGGSTLIVPREPLPYLTDQLFDRLVREEPFD